MDIESVRLLDIQQVSGIVGIKEPALRAMIRGGRFPIAFKVGGEYRIDREDLAAYITRLKAQALAKAA